MSINSNIRKLKLEINKPIISESGARKDKWVYEGNSILISIYEVDNRINTSSVRYNESTHIGLTSSNNVNSYNCRLIDENTIYQIKGMITHGRLNQLFLKVIKNG
ncbi:hypothetical protein [Clostridium oceanicum]|uniref:Phage head-tail joining protein n=1 Tax=Clostridium oceanicum TaxID=1543 RepID=A0ABN1JBY2_9CLOT